MLTDTRILLRRDNYEVLAECQAVPFADGGVAHLHSVRRQGIPEMFLRALRLDRPDCWCLVDLREVHRQLASDLPMALPRDRAGMVLYSLRVNFSAAGDFIQRCMANLMATWLPDHESRLDVAMAATPAIAFQPEPRRATA